MKTFRYQEYRRPVNGFFTYRLPSIFKNPAAGYLAAFEGGVMMPASLRNKGIQMFPINAKRQLPHCDNEIAGSADFSRLHSATHGHHESSQGLPSLATGVAGPFQAQWPAVFHGMRHEYRGVTKILSSQTGRWGADLYCLSALARDSCAPARNAGPGAARPAAHERNS